MQTRWLTSLYSVGRSLLDYAVDVLGIKDLEEWCSFEMGKTQE